MLLDNRVRFCVLLLHPIRLYEHSKRVDGTFFAALFFFGGMVQRCEGCISRN